MNRIFYVKIKNLDLLMYFCFQTYLIIHPIWIKLLRDITQKILNNYKKWSFYEIEF